MRLPCLWMFVLPLCLLGQDELSIKSPNGQVEFHIFLAPQADRTFSRLAYQADYRGKPVMDTSFLGLDIWEQEPLLGENTGLISKIFSKTPKYNSLIAQYMQNGSLGRRIDVEIRVFDDGIAFRYALAKSITMAELLIADEATEFVASKGAEMPKIFEVAAPPYPPMHLETERGTNNLVTRLARVPGKPKLAYEGKTPITTAWRVIQFGGTTAIKP